MNSRTTLLALAFAASCAATPASPPPPAPPAPPPQAANDAEALFKKMETALAARPFKIKFTSGVMHPASPLVQMKGSLSVEPGTTAELGIEGKVGAKKFTLILKSDGKAITADRTESPPPPDLGPLPPPAAVPPPKSLSANLAAAMARGGVWLAQDYFDGEYRAAADRHFKAMQGIVVPPPANETDVTQWHALRNFAMDKKEKIGGRDAQAVRYEMVKAGETLGIYTAVKVWIDAETSRPLKREGRIYTTMTRMAGGKEETIPTHASTWVETYE